MKTSEELHILAQGYLKLQEKNMELQSQISEMGKAQYQNTGVQVVDDTNKMTMDAKTAMALQRAKQMVDESQKIADEKGNQSDALLKSVAKLSTENEKLSKINAELSDEISNYKAELAKADSDKYKELHESSADLLNQITELKEKKVEAESSLSAAERENNQLKDKIEKLQAELEDTKKKLATKTEDLDILSAENDRLAKSNKDLKDYNEELVSKLAEYGETTETKKDDEFDPFAIA